MVGKTEKAAGRATDTAIRWEAPIGTAPPMLLSRTARDEGAQPMRGGHALVAFRALSTKWGPCAVFSF